jgi:hypothetical protein
VELRAILRALEPPDARGYEMSGSNVEIRLGGREAALLVGALFATAEWPFEQPAAKALLTNTLQERAQLLSRSISERWRARLQDAGLWNLPTGPWTRELIEQRGMLSDGLVIDESEVELAVAAVNITELEFSGTWGEFCIVVPGALDWYGLKPGDLARLRARLEMG